VVALRQLIDDRQRALDEAASAALIDRSARSNPRRALARLMDARVREHGAHLANAWARLRERHPRHYARAHRPSASIACRNGSNTG
jgi:hypothetical protein